MTKAKDSTIRGSKLSSVFLAGLRLRSAKILAHDSKHAALGIIMTNMLIKQSIKSFGVEKTMTSCKAEMKQIHMQNLFIPKHYYHELTPKQKSRMVESFCS